MTDVLTVPTHFGDLSELSEGLVDRVGDGSLILYGPSAYEQGSVVSFCILLADDSTALEGHGRINEVYDGGEEREPETRYDIVFDSLQLDGRNEVVYERIVLARESMVGDAPQTGEVDISQMEEEVGGADLPAYDEYPVEADLDAAVDIAMGDAPDLGEPPPLENYDEPAEFVSPSQAPEEYVADAADDGQFEAFEAVEEAGTFEEYVEPPAGPPAGPPANPMQIVATEGPLGRPVFAASWSPTAPAPEPRPSTGWFLYEAGVLPAPAHAPRPEISPDMRVAPAPRPTEESLAAAEAANAPPPPPASAPPPPSVPPESVALDETQNEMPLPDDDAEIAPAVEPEYVSVGDAEPSDSTPPEASFSDDDSEQDESPLEYETSEHDEEVSAEAAAMDGEPAAVDVDEFEVSTGEVDPGDLEPGFEAGGFEDFGDVEIDEI